MMKKIYDAPALSLMSLSSADVITLSSGGTLGINNWDEGFDVSQLNFQ